MAKRKTRAPRKKSWYCRACGKRITGVENEMKHEGRSRYTFFNPAGMVFHIGLFDRADTKPEGDFSEDFSWFPGFRWRVELCPQCYEHLGWIFRGERKFTALVLPRLVKK